MKSPSVPLLQRGKTPTTAPALTIPPFEKGGLGGICPANWCVTTLNEITRSVGGGTPSKSDSSYWVNGTVPWVSPKDMKVFDLRGSEDLVSQKALARLSLVPEGSILVVVRSGILSRILPVAINHLPVTINQDMRAFVPALEINARFLAWQLLANQREILAKCSKDGTTVASIEAVALAAYPLALPPLPEQHRIVAKIEELFSELDQGVASLKTAREQLKVYRQSLLKNAFEGKLTAAWRAAHADQLETAAALQQRIAREREARYRQQLAEWERSKSPSIPLFQRGKTTQDVSTSLTIPPFEKGGLGGISKPKAPKPLPTLTAEELAELPELPAGWGWVKTGDLGTLGTGVTPLKSRTDFYAGGTIPWVTSGALNANHVTEASDYVTFVALRETNLRLYPKHTLLVALYGEGKTRGKCSELLIEATTNQAIAAIVLDGTAAILRPYVKWFFQKNYGDIRLKSSGGVQPNLNLGIIENTALPLCSVAEADQLVKIIESKLSEADQLDQTLATALQQADALRQSILKKAFCGQLVAQDANDEPAAVLLERIRAARSAKQPARRGRSAGSQA